MKQQLAVGIDIGGTNTVFGIVDRRGNLLCDGSVSTRKHEEVAFFIDELRQELSPLIAEVRSEGEVKGIGVGAPNGNYFKGTIEFAPNLPWRGVIPLVSLLQDAFGLPAVLTNDANAAAIGEMTYGAARGMKDFLMITLGTGLGSGIVANGELIYGHDGFAGELGHVIIDYDEGRSCGCGRNGCLETYVSATGIARTMKELLGKSETESLLRGLPSEGITSKSVRDAAVQGDKLAVEAFEYTGKLLGQQLANFVAFSSPEAIILFGGLTKAGDLILRPTVHHMEQNLLQIYKNKIKVLLSELKESDAAILGASALVWEMKS